MSLAARRAHDPKVVTATTATPLEEVSLALKSGSFVDQPGDWRGPRCLSRDGGNQNGLIQC